ncbi:PREDICTED: EMBRYONIC FLOWER 1, partial [Prunus dulcis]
IIYMYPMLHKLEANNGNGTMKPQNISKSSICSINRNPADLNMPEVGNGYMIRGEDLKFGKRISR